MLELLLEFGKKDIVMGIEELMYIAVAIFTGALVVSEIGQILFGSRFFSVWRVLYGLLIGLLFALVGGAIGKLVGNEEMGMIIGGIIGLIMGYTKLINKLIKWLWDTFTQTARVVVGIILVALVIFTIVTYVL